MQILKKILNSSKRFAMLALLVIFVGLTMINLLRPILDNDGLNPNATYVFIPIATVQGHNYSASEPKTVTNVRRQGAHLCMTFKPGNVNTCTKMDQYQLIETK